MRPLKPSEKKRLTRFAVRGALFFGFVGFGFGCFICLHYQLPIPPLFITEFGLLIGGCLGALLALLTGEDVPMRRESVVAPTEWKNL